MIVDSGGRGAKPCYCICAAASAAEATITTMEGISVLEGQYTYCSDLVRTTGAHFWNHCLSVR